MLVFYCSLLHGQFTITITITVTVVQLYYPNKHHVIGNAALLCVSLFLSENCLRYCIDLLENEIVTSNSDKSFLSSGITNKENGISIVERKHQHLLTKYNIRK